MIRGLWRRIAEADARVGNAWLLTATLLVALVCAIETMRSIMVDGLPAAAGALAFLLVAATVLMSFRPVEGCLLTTVLVVVMTFGASWVPSGALLAVMLTIGIAGYVFGWFGALILAVTVMGWVIGPVGEVAASGHTGANAQTADAVQAGAGRQVILGVVTIDGPMPVIVLAVGCLLAGVAARWNHERGMAQAELDHRRRRERAARDIHDYVSNDLAYLILRLDKDIADDHATSVEELRELRKVAVGALNRTHQVIDVMEGRGDSGDVIGDGGAFDGDDDEAGDGAIATDTSGLRNRGIGGGNITSGDRLDRGSARRKDGVPSGVSGPTLDLSGEMSGRSEQAKQTEQTVVRRVRCIARNGDRRLAELGFDGRTIISTVDVGPVTGIDETDADRGVADDYTDYGGLLSGLLEELYGNIAKHADPVGGYVVTIRFGSDAVHVVCTDRPRVQEPGERADIATGGTGLAWYGTLLEERKGVLRITTQDAEWTLSVVVPYVFHNG
ncbi:2CS histidine protein kinase [Bifidobacterium myosotis]|uniref:2CS histidine protein kinase n=1 Tax=Bifidobacterium myosotis TaxID=1630166 RepID=A0A5M9ZII7_9BIFI|nr:2CS histidine protein kinase [Bifidobacterium myosotis]KAA8827295.1 2CS histidine protein kinase [Bifidobacterium myosotis]